MSSALEATVYQRLREHLSYLELTAAAEHLGAELDRAQQREGQRHPDPGAAARHRGAGHPRAASARTAALCALPGPQDARRLRLRLPALARPRSDAPSSRRCASSRRSATCILLGPPGVGKTHLATALGHRGHRGRLPDLLHLRRRDLVANLQSAHLEGTADYKMRTYTGPSVLVIDELGYLPLDQTSANWIFQIVSRRYERGSDRADLQPWLRRLGPGLR